MSLSELQERVLNVLKMFDKVDPDKVNAMLALGVVSVL